MTTIVRAVEKWALDKPPAIRIIAPLFASYFLSYDDNLKELRARRLSGKQYKLERLTPWYKQYHSFQGNLRRCLKHIWLELSESLPKIHNDVSNANIAVFLLSKSMYEFDLSDASIPPEAETLIREFVDECNMEFQFFVFVVIPCLLLYREYPLSLYRKARRGDIEALKKLLSLDPYLLHNPRIGKVIQDFRFKNRQSQFNTLLDTAKVQPSYNISRKKWLLSIAGLMSLMSSVTGKQLTEPQIRDFFNAVAWDTKRQRKHPDLPEKGETFRRQISRERHSWLKGLYPDKNI